VDQAVYIKVGEALLESEGGLADFEVSDVAKVPLKTVRQALRDLANASAIYDGGDDRRMSPDGSRSKVWFASRRFDFSQPPTKVATQGQKPRVPKVSRRTKEQRNKVMGEFVVCARRVAERLPEFTADDVRNEFDATSTSSFAGVVDARISGPAMLKAAQLQVCLKTDRVVTSNSERRHGGLTAVYRSLLCASPTPPTEDVEFLRARVASLEAENARLRAQLNL